MANKRKKKHWWQNVKFKYKLTIVNENTLEEVFALYVSKLNGLSVLLGVLFVLFTLTSLLMVYTPLRNYLPGYMSNELRSTIVANALKVDSLEKVAEQQHRYVQNIQDLLACRVELDSVQTMTDIDSLREMPVDMLEEATEREEQFRMQYEEEERYNISATTNNPNNNLVFFKPTIGEIDKPFDPVNGHLGIDITTKPSTPIVSIYQGIVLYSAYTLDEDYFIQVIHPQGFISVYKGAANVFKKSGDIVQSGEVIAIMGEDSSKSLHFELWRDSQAQNPLNYIVFE